MKPDDIPDGMNLRDWLAGQALIGILSNPIRMDKKAWDFGVMEEDWSCEAGDAYKIADWMMEARKQ